MTHEIIETIIKFALTGALGYCVSLLKNIKKARKKREDAILEDIKLLKETQLSLQETQLLEMRNDLSNKFYVYDAMEKVEDYLVMSFREKCERYFKLGGDSWIHPMYDKSAQWKIKSTKYLK